MKKSSHISSNRHPRRKAIPGLTPPEILAQMQKEAKHGKPLRKVRSKAPVEKGSVLPDSRDASPSPPRNGGVFAAPSGDDSQRGSGHLHKAVSDSERTSTGRGSQLSAVLKRMLGDAPPSELLAVGGITQVGSNAEALAAVVMRLALEGKQWAVEMVRDQSEGKPQRGVQVDDTGPKVESFLDRISTARLNDLAKGVK